MSRVYLAGPMRSIPEFNFPAFFKAGDELSEMGHEVHNPALEDDMSGFRWRGTTGNEVIDDLWPEGLERSLRDVLAEDIAWILDHAHAVAVLPGWEKSSGARAEVSAALAVGIPVMRVADFWTFGDPMYEGYLIRSVPDPSDFDVEPMPSDEGDGYGTVYLGNKSVYEEFINRPLLQPVSSFVPMKDPYAKAAPESKQGLWDRTLNGPDEEVRVTSETGGQKGAKRARFDLIPTGALHQLAEHYGKGAEKYEPVNGKDNWRNGYAWSLSYAAMQRHANAFWSGEDVDPETGSPHLVAVAWHAFSLLTFMADPNLREKFDDRQDNR